MALVPARAALSSLFLLWRGMIVIIELLHGGIPMAYAGLTITNPHNGDRITFLKTAADTHGELLAFEEVRGGGFQGPPAHLHPHQEERFIVLSGSACLIVNGQEHILKDGEELTIPPMTSHTWRNVSDGEVHLITEFRPALKIENFFESLYVLAGQGKRGELSRPDLLQMALLALAYESYMAGPPIWVQKVIFSILKPIALLRGYRAHVPYLPAHEKQKNLSV